MRPLAKLQKKKCRKAQNESQTDKNDYAISAHQGLVWQTAELVDYKTELTKTYWFGPHRDREKQLITYSGVGVERGRGVFLHKEFGLVIIILIEVKIMMGFLMIFINMKIL